jgi:hypothetical protein
LKYVYATTQQPTQINSGQISSGAESYVKELIIRKKNCTNGIKQHGRWLYIGLPYPFNSRSSV